MDVTSTFTTSVALNLNASGSVYENKIKFTLVQDMKTALDDLGIPPEQVSIKKHIKLSTVTSPFFHPTPIDVARSTPIDVMIFIKPIYAEGDILDETKRVLLLRTNTQFGNLFEGGQKFEGENGGISQLENMFVDANVKQVNLIFQVAVPSDDPSRLFSPSFTMSIGIGVAIPGVKIE